MGNNNIDCVVSFHEDGIRLAVGYVNDGMPIVLNAVGVEYPNLLEYGQISDISKAVLCINRALDHISSSMDGLNITSTGILMPVNDSQIDVIVANYPTGNGLCQPRDVNACLNLFKSKLILDDRDRLVDIIPSSYRTDGGHVYKHVAPLGEATSTLNITASRIFASSGLKDTYIQAVIESGLDVSFVNSNAYAIGRYFMDKIDEKPSVVIGLDRKFIDVACIKDGFVIGCSTLNFGLDQVIDQLSMSLAIDYEVASNYLLEIGINPLTKKNFSTDHGFGVLDFSNKAKSLISKFISYLVISIDDKFKFDYSNIILSGNDSLIPGLVNLFNEKTDKAILPGMVDCVGARKRSYADVIGGLLLSNDHINEDVALTKTSILSRTNKDLG